MANGPVSLPRSSNRTCGFLASGFPTGFVARPTMGSRCACVSGTAAHLRLAIEFSPTAPELIGHFEARRQFARPPRLRKRARSQGPLLRRSYPASALVRPCPTPARSIAKCDVEAATSERTGLPRLPAMPFQRAASITPMDRTGACVDCFPVRATFPEFPAGRRPY